MLTVKFQFYKKNCLRYWFIIFIIYLFPRFFMKQSHKTVRTKLFGKMTSHFEWLNQLSTQSPSGPRTSKPLSTFNDVNDDDLKSLLWKFLTLHSPFLITFTFSRFWRPLYLSNFCNELKVRQKELSINDVTTNEIYYSCTLSWVNFNKVKKMTE